MNQPKKSFRIKLLKWLWNYLPWIMVFLLILITGSLYMYLRGEKKSLEEEKRAALREATPPVRVITLVLKPETIKDRINLPAVVEPFEDLWIKTEVSGQIVGIFADEGDSVKKGQVLVRLDDRDYISRVSGIEASYNLAKLEYDRISRLVEKKIVADMDLDRAEAQMKTLRSQLDEAKLALSRTEIRAPIDGKLNEMSAKIGDWLGVDRQVAQIIQIDDVKVTVGIPESDVASLMNLEQADIHIGALNNLKVSGEKIFLSRQPDTLARLYNMKFLVSNPDGTILPGMFARVDLVKKVYDNAISIPLYAIIAHQNERYVYVENNGRAEKRHVEPGILVGWKVQVLSGLEPGDKLIIVGHRSLNEGQDVEVIREVKDPGEIIGS